MDHAAFVPTGILATGPCGEGNLAALDLEDDRAEPGATHPAHQPVPSQRNGVRADVWAEPVCQPLHSGRRAEATEKRMKQTAVEMTGPQPRRGAEKWKTKSTFPTFPLAVLIPKPKPERRPGGGRFAPAFRLIIQ